MAINYIVSSGGDPSLFMPQVPGGPVGQAQGPSGSFPQFPSIGSWADFQSIPPTVVAWIVLLFLLVFVMRSTLRLQG